MPETDRTYIAGYNATIRFLTGDERDDKSTYAVSRFLSVPPDSDAQQEFIENVREELVDGAIARILQADERVSREEARARANNSLPKNGVLTIIPVTFELPPETVRIRESMEPSLNGHTVLSPDRIYPIVCDR